MFPRYYLCYCSQRTSLSHVGSQRASLSHVGSQRTTLSHVANLFLHEQVIISITVRVSHICTSWILFRTAGLSRKCKYRNTNSNKQQ